MFELFSAIAVAVILLYAVVILLRKKRRAKLIEDLEYEKIDLRMGKVNLNSADLSDFLQLPLKIRKGFSKNYDKGRFLVSDLTTIMARGAYSGPSQVTYFIFCPSDGEIPDFTLRSKRFLETSFELRGSITLDDAGRIVLWGEDSAVKFLADRNPELVAMLQERTDLVVRGVKGKLVVWVAGGYVSNRRIQDYLRFLEVHCYNVN